MNYRRMMLVAFLLLAVLTLGAVSASEDADVLAADSVDEASVDASLDDEIISEGGGDSLASSDDASALEVTSENFEFDYQTHEAVSKQEDEVLHVEWHNSVWGILNLQVKDNSNTPIFNDEVNVTDANGEHSWTVSYLFSGNDYALGYYTFDLVFTDMDDNEVHIIDDLPFQLTYCNIEEYRDESVYVDYPFDVIRIYERTEELEVYVNNAKITGEERNYDDGPTAWNLNELNITEPGIYNIIINATNPNLGHVETFEMTLNVIGFDPDEFRVFTNYEGIHDFDENDPVIYLYCANEDTPNIVAIAPNGVKSYRDSVTGAMLSWTLSDLGIEENGDYEIIIGNEFDRVVEDSVWINVWHMDDEDDWILDYNSDLITFRELVTLSDRYDSGRLVITDSEGNVLFNRTVDDSWLNYDMKGYKYDQYRGYVVFKEDLVNVSTRVYDLTITYYGDEDEVQSVNTTVCLDYDSYVTDEEIDITDYNSTLFSIYVFDVMDNGHFEIELVVGDDEDEYPYVSHDIEVNDEMIGQTLDITRQNYDLPEGEYDVRVRFVSNDDDPHDHYVEYWKYSYFHDSLTIVDNTKFRVRMESESILDENSKFLVYCPEDYVGQTITIEVASDEGSHSIDYAIPESGYNYFTLDDLSITVPGPYVFNVYDADDESLLSEPYEYEIGNPLVIREICVLGSEDLERSPVAVIYMDKTDKEIRLVLNDEDGNVLFNQSLDDAYYDTYERDGGYFILYSHLNNLSAGTYALTASYYCDGILRLTSSSEIRVVERNYVEDDETGISIELYDYYEHNLNDEEDLIAFVAVPDYECGYVTVVLMDDENVARYDFTFNEIDDDDGLPVFFVSLFGRDVEEGDYLVNVTYFDGDDNPVLNSSAWMSFYYGGDDDDEVIEDIEFYVLEDDDGQAVFEIGDSVHVASLLIPDNDEHVDSGVTITITKNGEEYGEFSTSDSYSEYHENMGAYEYPICMDLNDLKDKDLLRFNVDCFDENGRVWSYAIEINGDNAIFHGYDEVLEYYVFYGNASTGDLNDPELMGPHPNENFISFSVPDAYDVTEGGVVVTDGSGTEILNNSLDEFEDVGYSYDVLGNVYAISLDDFDPMDLPENETITVTFTAGNDTITQKRIRIGDYVYKILTPEDFTYNSWSNYNFEVADEVYKKDNDAVVIFGNSNRQSIEIDFGGGYFTVYVNDTKVEDLGDVLREAWRNSDAYDEDYDNEEVWGSELMLVNLRGGSGSLNEFHLSLANLNITEAGTYNIRITHTPDDPENVEEPYIYYAETEIINEDITYNPDGSAVEILPESKYGNDMPFLFGFELGDNLIDESNSILIYINGTLAFNSPTLYYEENEEGEEELVGLWRVPASWLDESVLNEYGKLDEGEYEAVIYFVEGEDGDPIEIAHENFAILKQRGDMNFTMDYTFEDDGQHTVIYANIPDGDWQDYSLIINVGDSQEIYPETDDEEEGDGWNTWFDEYCIFKDDDILDQGPLDEIIGQGTFAFDLGVLEPGTHVRVSFDNGNDPVDPNLDFYHNEFTVVADDRIDTTLSASKLTTVYGRGDELVATLKDADGNPIPDAELIFTFGNIDLAAVTGADGKARLDVTLLPPKVYYATISFAGDELYRPSSVENVKVYVQKIATTLTAADVVTSYHNGARLVATLRDANGNTISEEKVTVTIGSSKWDLTTNSKGVVRFLTDRLGAGNYTAEISFKTTPYYYASSTTANIMIDGIDTTLSASKLTTVYGSGDELVATLKDADGNPISGAEVVFTLGDVNATAVTDADGQARLDVTTFTPKVYYASIHYLGGDAYNPSSIDSVKVYVQKVSTDLSASDIVTAYDGGELVATLTDADGQPLANEKVTITIDGVKTTLTTDADGQVRFPTDGLSVGSYAADIAYKATTYYYASSTSANIVVTKMDTTLTASKLTTVYGKGDEFVATLKDANGNPIVGADIVITLGDINTTVVTGDDGKARLDVTTFTPKVYYATISYAGDDTYNPSVKENVKVYVQKISTVLTSSDVVGAYKNGTRLVATLKDANGKAIANEKVTVTINGAKWDLTTNSKGVVRFLTDRLEAGNYTAEISFKATPYYYASSTTANILITSKLDTTLTASKLTTVYGSGDEFVATLKDANGNPISGAELVVRLGDVDIVVVTGADGKARLDVTSFTPKVYYATVSYAGDDAYNPSTVENVKVYVQKVSTSLAASDVSAAYGSGELVATLTDANGQAIANEKVSITIDGVKTTLTSDANGQVRLSTAGLAVGSYTAEIAYKATTYYYASSTTANVVIT